MLICTAAAALAAALFAGPLGAAGNGPSGDASGSLPQDAAPYSETPYSEAPYSEDPYAPADPSAADPGPVDAQAADPEPVNATTGTPEISQPAATQAPPATTTSYVPRPAATPKVIHKIIKGKNGIPHEILVVPIPADPGQKGPVPVAMPDLGYQAFHSRSKLRRPEHKARNAGKGHGRRTNRGKARDRGRGAGSQTDL
ncbi:hypothetical protein GCM10009530_37700 [Microbispora corallina]|uniref:Uncharacterized protein n=1 Tax=Microbispora corallina TaxID=83302 RepID=A0ABQ4G2F6_9ACTN|nr:hypothetical protein [Microbispora corallina]GIH41219.1 hypothetical protein Mco01_42190 [Microbispora corallina]